MNDRGVSQLDADLRAGGDGQDLAPGAGATSALVASTIRSVDERSITDIGGGVEGPLNRVVGRGSSQATNIPVRRLGRTVDNVGVKPVVSRSHRDQRSDDSRELHLDDKFFCLKPRVMMECCREG